MASYASRERRFSVQWRLDREIDHLGGLNLYTDEEIEKVCEVTIPISALASRPLVCHTHVRRDATGKATTWVCGGAMEILWIVLPGFVVGVLVADSVRRIFSDDKRLIWRLLRDQPVTMGVSATTIGSVLVWAVLAALGFS